MDFDNISRFSELSAYYKNNANTFPWTNTLGRAGAFPVEKFSVFNSYADAVRYIKGENIPNMGNALGLAYEGQIISVTNNGKQFTYIVDTSAEDGLRRLGKEPDEWDIILSCGKADIPNQEIGPEKAEETDPFSL